MIKTACPTTLNLPYSEREIKIKGFGGRPPFGGRPGPLGPPLNPALLCACASVYRCRCVQSDASCAAMSAEGDFIVGDCSGTVHVLNVDAANQSFNTIQNAHAVRYLLISVSRIILRMVAANLSADSQPKSVGLV